MELIKCCIFLFEEFLESGIVRGMSFCLVLGDIMVFFVDENIYCL